MSLAARLDRMPPWAEWCALGLVLAAIWLGSSIPPAEFPDLGIFSYDKLLHLLEYLGLGSALWLVGRRRWLPRIQARTGSALSALLLGVVLPGALWALTDEVHQLFVGRDCSLWDWLADVAGLLLAVALVRAVERRDARP
ncbi:MAG: VanZ family protein [bacterium]|jgi:VanZ family protein|nr:VanZ family protein [bacterium]